MLVSLKVRRVLAAHTIEEAQALVHRESVMYRALSRALGRLG